jgi:hypothetical protein
MLDRKARCRRHAFIFFHVWDTELFHYMFIPYDAADHNRVLDAHGDLSFARLVLEMGFASFLPLRARAVLQSAKAESAKSRLLSLKRNAPRFLKVMPRLAVPLFSYTLYLIGCVRVVVRLSGPGGCCLLFVNAHSVTGRSVGLKHACAIPPGSRARRPAVRHCCYRLVGLIAVRYLLA